MRMSALVPLLSLILKRGSACVDRNTLASVVFRWHSMLFTIAKTDMVVDERLTRSSLRNIATLYEQQQ
jgi:hypothetical protein